MHEPSTPFAKHEGRQWRLFVKGFLAMLPLWTGAIPAGIAYSLAAHAAGLSFGETQLMSLVVFSAAAQLGTISLLTSDTPLALLLGTAIALNVQFVLLGLAIGRQFQLSWGKRLVAAWFLTDAAYGIAAAHRPLQLPVLLGAGVSMYVGWNFGTALGVVAGHVLVDVRQLGLDIIVPLAFVAVLIPLLQTPTTVGVALLTAVTTVWLHQLVPGGMAVFIAGIIGIAAGAWWEQARGQEKSRNMTARQLEAEP